MKLMKKSVSILLSFIMIFSVFTILPITADAAGQVSYVYRSWNGTKVVDETRTVPSSVQCIPLNEAKNDILDKESAADGNHWYIVDKNMTINQRLYVTTQTVNIILYDGATLTLNSGITVRKDATLNIFGQANDSGKIYSHISATDNRSFAIIGGDSEPQAGNINIYGGTLDLHTLNDIWGYRGACIGGGVGGSPQIISIYGGKLKLFSQDGACIGGGKGGAVSSFDGDGIRIYGGTIDAMGYLGAAIGNGYTYSGTPKSGIAIYGGQIKANGVAGAAGIGGGSGEDGKNGSSNGPITIYDGYISALGTGSKFTGAGIGCGACGNAGTIEISNAYVDASASAWGAGIGSGKEGNGGNITITDSTVTAESSNYRTQQDFLNAFNQRLFWGGPKTDQRAYADGIVSLILILIEAFDVKYSGAGIGAGHKGRAGTVTIKNSNVYAASGNYAAGIGSGKGRNGGNVTITGSTVTAKSGDYAAAIGGGDDGDSGTIHITGGEVTATGGDKAAAIGGGDKGGFNDITIDGNSKVTATGGKYGAGIGSGNKGKKTQNISITGSTVTATGGKDAAGIGGGDHSNGGTVVIRDSVVTASGGGFGSGIGGGDANDSATVGIYGNSTVTATAGGSRGEQTAIGRGDYFISKPDVRLDLSNELIVNAGYNENNGVIYAKNQRYEAAIVNPYVKIYACPHKDSEWKYDNTSTHRKVCTLCGVPFGDAEKHDFDADNICKVCKGAATMSTITFVEKNSAGEEVKTTKQAAKWTHTELPECKNVPDGKEFIGWQYADEFRNPGDSVQVTEKTYEAIYAELVETQYIDRSGKLNTVKARRLKADIPYLSAGRYVADSNINYDAPVTTRGEVDLILCDGVTVNLNNSQGNDRRQLTAGDKLSEFTLYGQTNQSGTLQLEADRGWSMQFEDLTMYGGRILTNRSVIVVGAEIRRGTLEANSLSLSDYLYIGGGNVSVDTCSGRGDIYIGWTEQADSIRFNDFITQLDSLTVEEGQALTDGENVYTGEVDLESISGKTLKPHILHHYGEPEWFWSVDYDDATAVFTCTDEGCDDALEEDAEITVEEKPGSFTYTATVDFSGEEYKDVKEVLKHNSLQYFPEILPTVSGLDDNGEIMNGNIDYWYCSDCGKYFADEDCSDEITLADTVLPFLSYKATDGYIAVTDYNGFDMVVDVPDTVPVNYPDESLRGKPVTSIHHYAFENTFVTDVTIGDSVQMIGWHAFNGCNDLEEVVVGSGLNFMYSEAFHNCPALIRFESTTRQVFADGKYYDPFTGGTDNVTVYGYHFSSLQKNLRLHSTKTKPFIGLDRHKEPEWVWDSDYGKATAEFACINCSYRDTLTDSDIAVTDEKDKTVYTAEVNVTGETYTDTKTVYKDGIGARLIGHTLSLDGDIGINFYMELSGSVIEHKDTAYMQFTIPKNGEPDKPVVLIKDARTVEADGKTYYVFKCQVAAKEMASEIKAQIIDGEKQGTEYTYSVREYADYLLKHTEVAEYAKAAPLVKATLNYGAYSQLNFDKNPDTLANVDLTDEEKALGEVTVDIADYVTGGLPEGTTFEGATLSLKSETTLSLYFMSSDTLTFSCDGYTVEKATSGDYQIARIRGIKAKHIGDVFTLNVNGATVKYSPLNYCKNVLADNTQDENLKNVVKALYLYWKAADSYFA